MICHVTAPPCFPLTGGLGGVTSLAAGGDHRRRTRDELLNYFVQESITDVLLVIANHVQDPAFRQDNVLLVEILYLLFRDRDPAVVASVSLLPKPVITSWQKPGFTQEQQQPQQQNHWDQQQQQRRQSQLAGGEELEGQTERVSGSGFVADQPARKSTGLREALQREKTGAVGSLQVEPTLSSSFT